MLDQPENNAKNFATSEKEPSVKFAAHGLLNSKTRKPVSNGFAKAQVRVMGFCLTWEGKIYYFVLFSKTMANVAKSTHFEAPHSRVRFRAKVAR